MLQLHQEKDTIINVHKAQELSEKIITLQKKLDESVKNNTALEEESRKLVSINKIFENCEKLCSI